jgi:hypothetical protein
MASNLKIDGHDLNYWLELLRMIPSFSEMIKQVEKQEKHKEKNSPPDPFDPSKEFYIAKPVSGEDVQSKYLKDIFHIDLGTMDDDEDEQYKVFYKEAYIRYFEFL